jgi:hypothetical protein
MAKITLCVADGKVNSLSSLVTVINDLVTMAFRAS